MTSMMQCTAEIKEWKVTSAIQMKLVKLLEMKTLIGRIRPFTTKIKKNFCRMCPKDRKTKKIFQKEILLMKPMHKSLQKGEMILSCPEYRKMMKEMIIWVLEVEDIISGSTLIQTTQKISDTKEKIELRPETNGALFFIFILHFSRLRRHCFLNKYGDFLSATIPFKIIQGLRNQH